MAISSVKSYAGDSHDQFENWFRNDKNNILLGYDPPYIVESCAEKGDPVVTVHYLKDGLLIFEYTMLEAPEQLETPKITVSKIRFYEDYMVPTADGAMTSHLIFVHEKGVLQNCNTP